MLPFPADMLQGHSATLLPSGKVLVAGGLGYEPWEPNRTALFDPANDSFEAGPPMLHQRDGGTATLVGGVVLVAGGRFLDGTSTAYVPTFEQYNPVTNSFSELGSAGMPRTSGAVTVLRSGKVLLTGGAATRSPYPASNRTELYDATTRIFTESAPLSTPRAGHTSTLLDSGEVLVVGGAPVGSYTFQTSLPLQGMPTIELFDPATATWRDGGQMQLPRVGHTATLLPNGKVLVIGGTQSAQDGEAIELYDPTSDSFETVGATLRARAFHATTRLSSGKLLVAGGRNRDNEAVSELELCDPTTGMCETIPDLSLLSRYVYAVLQTNDDVIIAGDDAAFRYVNASHTIQPLDGVPQYTTGLAALPNGDTIACGRRRCARLASAGVQFQDDIYTRLQDFDADVVALPNGSALVVGMSPYTAIAQHFTVDPTPHGAPRPIILAAPGEMAGGSEVVIHGARFQRHSALGYDTGRSPAITPIAVLVPDGASPIFAEVTYPSDSSFTLRVPLQVPVGPARLYVIVDSVPSESAFVKLTGAAVAISCSDDSECASGFCVESVCCDAACGGGCESCLAARKASGPDGTCGFVATATDPKDACEPALEGSCGQTGQCGSAGLCALDPDGTVCGTDGEGECKQGVCSSVGTCSEDGSAQLDGDSEQDCSPYRCSLALGTCLTSCQTNRDCSEGLVCTVDGLCDAPLNPGSEDGCLLSRSKPSDRDSGLLWLLALAAVVARVWRNQKT